MIVRERERESLSDEGSGGVDKVVFLQEAVTHNGLILSILHIHIDFRHTQRHRQRQRQRERERQRQRETVRERGRQTGR